jgi:hypothetical protein
MPAAIPHAIAMPISQSQFGTLIEASSLNGGQNSLLATCKQLAKKAESQTFYESLMGTSGLVPLGGATCNRRGIC